MAQSSVEITIPGDMAERIRAKVASGAYASESEVIEGLLALEAQEADIERWLKETVAPTYDRIKSGEEAPDTDRRGFRRLAQALRGEEDAEDFLAHMGGVSPSRP